MGEGSQGGSRENHRGDHYDDGRPLESSPVPESRRDSGLSKILGRFRKSPVEKHSNAELIRGDLLGNCIMLKTLGSGFFEVGGVAPRGRGVVFAAPHEAPPHTPLSSGHDVNTGPVARRLAGLLGAKYVIVSELRTFVDVNKSPDRTGGLVTQYHPGHKAFHEVDRRLKLYYQSQVFADSPRIIVEIHGHSSGNHDIEVSTGFPLDDKVPQDRVLIRALRDFKESLRGTIGKLKTNNSQPVTIGVYPLDQDVRFTARGTHTFNKIERLREIGLDVAGLHIELSYRLRTEHTKAGGLCDAVADCLAQACSSFLEGLRRPPKIDPKSHLFDGFADETGSVKALSRRGLILKKIPREYLGKEVAVFAPEDLAKLGLNPGDSVAVCAESDFHGSLNLVAAKSDGIARSSIGIGKRLRDELDLAQGERVHVGKRVGLDTERMVLGVVAGIKPHLQARDVEVDEATASALDSRAMVEGVKLNALTGESGAVRVRSSDVDLPRAAINISEILAAELGITCGDLVCFVKPVAAKSMDGKWAE